MNSLVNEVERMHRAVLATGGGEHAVQLRRTYSAAPADVWDACTDPQRIARWLVPVGGDLHLGGHYSLDGNASGKIVECEPPRRLALTWAFGDAVSHVALDLAPDGDGTLLTLTHTVADDDHWATYGPGAVGVGWDLSLLALGRLIAAAEAPVPTELPPAMRASAAAWGAADDAPEAAARAARTSAFYTGEPAG